MESSPDRNPPSRRGTLFVVSAPSGAGKTSLVKALLDASPGLEVSISHTTRAMRPGEQDGVHYHFVDTERFQELVRADGFLEHATVFDHHYGTSRGGVEASLESGRDVILEIDWQGARQVRTAMPDCRSVFILPPSREVLEQRLRARAQDAEAVIQRRLGEAQAEMSHHAEFDYLVVNDDFDQALSELLAIVTADRLRMPRQRAEREALIRALLA
jgi:guanylate kinase